jgi:hypothetical protein
MVGPGGCRRPEHSGEVKQCLPDSGYMLWSDWKSTEGRTTVDYEWRSAYGCTR